jgi:hypothetical protein
MRVRHRFVTGVVPAVFWLGTTVATAERRPPVELAVDLQVRTAVPSDVLRDTKIEVERTFRASGVRIVWVEPDGSPAVPLRTLIVLGADAPAPRGVHASGDTILGAVWSHDTARVYYDRVASLVADRQIAVSQVLAHVMAHELGHLLLLTDDHESFGVMRRDVPLEQPALRRFTREQSRLIRAAIVSGQRYAAGRSH